MLTGQSRWEFINCTNASFNANARFTRQSVEFQRVGIGLINCKTFFKRGCPSPPTSRFSSPSQSASPSSSLRSSFRCSISICVFLNLFHVLRLLENLHANAVNGTKLEMCVERNGKKTGTGKKLERNAFFPFPFLHFLTTFFFPFLAKIVKNG